MATRSAFPRVFWVANLIEVLERFAYYGIYFGFGIYMTHLGFSRGDLGVVQSLFLLVSYGVPVFSGSFADRFGFKPVLIVSYLAYLPSILLLLMTNSLTGIAITMLSIGFAAGIFKPLVAGSVRVLTDSTNKTLGFGIFYAMVNIGGTLGPIVAGKLRVISWSYAFLAAAVAIALMLVVTIFFYEEPPRERRGKTVGETLVEIWHTLKDLKFFFFLLILGLGFWLPFWAFFNLCALYIDSNLDTARLYVNVSSVLGSWFTDTFLSAVDDKGVRRILGETVGNTGWVIIVFQLLVSKYMGKVRALPAFMTGLAIAGLGFFTIGRAATAAPALVFLGIALFALGEMICSPRIQEYITWIAPKDKAGLYMGSNFLATMVGGYLSGKIYTAWSQHFVQAGVPGRIWDMMALNMLAAIVALVIFVKVAGEFKEMEA
ncbi:MAG TPA: MFS transporter [Candidatus Polarisedimenticolia bacterium]|jgi:dipeptide/tripeptide permease|nr:MFS transporter [Candidatus Polarisedimenticolia bacterium]